MNAIGKALVMTVGAWLLPSVLLADTGNVVTNQVPASTNTVAVTSTRPIGRSCR